MGDVMNRTVLELTVDEVMERMGSAATRNEAAAMKRILISAGYAKYTTDEISSKDWLRMIDLAISD